MYFPPETPVKKLALVLSLLLAALPARADLVITLQTVEPRFAPQIITIKAKDDKYRTDVSQNLSSISDLVSDDVIIINHAEKTYRKISGARIRSQNAPPHDVDPMLPKAPATPPQPTDTGKSEKIGDYTVEIYTAHNIYATYTYWVTKDYPDYAVISNVLKKIQARNTDMNKADTSTPDLSNLDGLVLKFQVITGAGKSSTTTLLSAKIQPVAEDEFHVPEGYTETSERAQPDIVTPATPSPAQNP
jgi:hypothetical protein